MFCCVDRQATTNFHVTWLDNYQKLLAVGVPKVTKKYWKSMIWTVEGLMTMRSVVDVPSHLSHDSYIMPRETLFDPLDVAALMSLCDSVLSSGFRRYDMTFATLFPRIPVLSLYDHTHPGHDRRTTFHPSTILNENIQSNSGLLSLLRRFEASVDETRFRMLLLDVGVYDRVIKVHLIFYLSCA